jgi:hypothetical protein
MVTPFVYISDEFHGLRTAMQLTPLAHAATPQNLLISSAQLELLEWSVDH